MEKIDQVVSFLVELRDSIEDLLDELVPPSEDEQLELPEAKPPKTGRSVVVTTKDKRGGLQTPVPR